MRPRNSLFQFLKSNRWFPFPLPRPARQPPSLSSPPACSPSRWAVGAARHAGYRWLVQRGHGKPRCPLPTTVPPPLKPAPFPLQTLPNFISTIAAATSIVATGEFQFVASRESWSNSLFRELLLPLLDRFQPSIPLPPRHSGTPAESRLQRRWTSSCHHLVASPRCTPLG